MDAKLENTIKTFKEQGFETILSTEPDREHFGNWVLIRRKDPVVLRVTSDRGVLLVDLMQVEAFEGGANESDWFNWDVVARALGLEKRHGMDQIWSILYDLEALARGFSPENWTETKDLLLKVEADKRRHFMEGNRLLVHA